MKHFFYKIFSKLNYRIVDKSKELARDIDPIKCFLGTSKDQILIKARREIITLLQFYPELTIEQLGDGFLVYIQGQKIFVESPEDIFIIREVYVDRDYAFNGIGEFIILDIGCNIGITSIFFSEMKNVVGIYGFEPVKQSYNQAVRNCSQNELSQNKVKLFNYGLSNKNEFREFTFDKNNKGKTGIRSSQSQSDDTKMKVEVELRDVSKVLKSHLSKHQNEKVVLKIDCEGGEYNIFQRLDESDLISSVFAFLIEWHDEGSAYLESLLVKNKFIVTNRNLSFESGFIVAFNSNYRI